MSAVYIAGPMTGRPDFNYPAFDEAEVALRAAGHSPINPTSTEARNPTPGTAQPWQWYMRHAIKLVADADGIALLPEWESSRGARLEFQIAEALGLPARPIDCWLAAACSQCADVIDRDDVHAGHGMCGSCLHDARRSGWEPGQ